MNPLPLLLREFQVALRRTATLHLRLAFGGASMLLVIWSILVSSGKSGAFIFTVLVASGAVLSMAVAVCGTSDAICRERREGTLGFLFLTDLRAVDVVLGKLAAAALVPLYTLLAMIPAFAICVLVGGVPAMALVRGMLVLLAGLLYCECATLYVSSVCEDHRKAFGGAVLLLLVANPLWLAWVAFTASTGFFLLVLASFVLLGVLFFYGAAVQLRKNWRDPERGFVVKRRDHDIRGERRDGARLLDKIPVAWMMLRRRHGNRAARWLLLIGCGLLVAQIAGNPPTFAQAKIHLALLFAAHLGWQILLLVRTSYAFHFDQRSGALELLLGSRLSNEEIFAGFNSFLIRKSGPPLLALGALDLAYAMLLWTTGAGAMAVLPLAMGAVLWITLAGVGWLGVYRSLMMNHPALAMLAAYARLSLVPLILSLLFLAVPRTDLFKVAAFYIISSGFLAAFFAIDAKTALAEHGRTLLLRPATEKPPRIENEWSFIDWDETALSAVKAQEAA